MVIRHCSDTDLHSNDRNQEVGVYTIINLYFSYLTTSTPLIYMLTYVSMVAQEQNYSHELEFSLKTPLGTRMLLSKGVPSSSKLNVMAI